MARRLSAFILHASPISSVVSTQNPLNTLGRMASTTESSNPWNEDIRNQKQLLRKEIRARLKVLSRKDLLAESAQVWDRLFQLEAYQQAKSVGLFLSMPAGEISTDAVLVNAVDSGKQVFVPTVGKMFELADMELINVTPPDTSSSKGRVLYDGWPRNKWGIPEPPAHMPLVPADVGDIDLLVVPGLAFDRQGNRLGQGKGYYDRFIARMMKTDETKKPPFLVAVALQCQLVDSVPFMEYDYPMDVIIVPTETIVPLRAPVDST